MPQCLTQLLRKAAEKNPSPQDFRRDVRDAEAETEKPHIDSAVTPITPETPE